MDWNKSYSSEDFTLDKYAKIVNKATGYWSTYSNKYDINYSSILSKLITEAGRFCERYSSDLFISWKEVEKYLEELKTESKTFAFGFREDGVDHMEYIVHSFNNEGGTLSKYKYRSIYLLEINCNDGDITMVLGKY